MDAELLTLFNAVKPLVTHGCNVEIIGSWLWITGSIDQFRTKLIQSGFKYSKDKHACYYHKGHYAKFAKGKRARELSLPEIRSLFGS